MSDAVAINVSNDGVRVLFSGARELTRDDFAEVLRAQEEAARRRAYGPS